MDNPVQVTDIEARFRPLTDLEKVTVQDLLDDAWGLLGPHQPAMTRRVEAELLLPATIKAVVKAMVLRVLRNPDGIRQFGSDEASFTRDNTVSTGELYVSATELETLTGESPAAAGAEPHLSFSVPYRLGWR
ncbi:hypothetical protein [Modestobacter sp. VKM Ac-2985]|uniref:hypothetical protein n=1 Tax=Modestobacter sp. VKM Ac-2985 TaxID=3004139 RepID=UPI0022AB533A|nr:hypothetical protein [Modestobacter sp. VKM Ac-2985]MCZ2837142.1 hypothetical protein [Modestobacter sp. VKM Ac-2985]